MSTRFFGQFLLDLGEIDEAQLEEAIEAMDAANLRVGDLAIRKGILSRDQAKEIFLTQRGRDALFGELATEMGYLESSQVETLLEEQHSAHLYVGEALVRGGAFSSMRLVELLDQFKAQEERIGDLAGQIPSPLCRDPFASKILELLPRVVLRASMQNLKLGRIGPWMGSNEHSVATALELRIGGRPLTLGITMNEDMARELTLGMLRCQLSELAPSDFEDAVSEVSNLVVDTAKNALADTSVSIGVARAGQAPRGGYAIELLTADGLGALILAGDF